MEVCREGRLMDLKILKKVGSNGALYGGGIGLKNGIKNT